MAAKEAIVSSSQPVTGDKGNPYYTQQLNAAAKDTMVSSSQPVTGDKGNPYFSKAVDVAAQDAQIPSSTAQRLGGDGSQTWGDENLTEGDGKPLFSHLLGPDNGEYSVLDCADEAPRFAVI